MSDLFPTVTIDGVEYIRLRDYSTAIDKLIKAEGKLDALTTELALLRSKEAEYGWRSKGLMADKIAQQAEIIETHCMAPMIDGQCSAEKAALSRLDCYRDLTSIALRMCDIDGNSTQTLLDLARQFKDKWNEKVPAVERHCLGCEDRNAGKPFDWNRPHVCAGM
jgi:hypothetical protein